MTRPTDEAGPADRPSAEPGLPAGEAPAPGSLAPDAGAVFPPG